MIMFSDLIFYMFALLLLASCTMVISVRNPVYAVLYLIFAFFNTAGLFILIGAEFVAMILVIVYVGAVAVLFLFVVMMLDIKDVSLKERFVPYWPVTLLLGGVFTGELIFLIVYRFKDFAEGIFHFPSGGSAHTTNTKEIGEILYTDYFYIFQLIGVLLLAAMVAAIVLTLRYRPGVRRQNIRAQIARQASETIEMTTPAIGKGIDI